MALRSVPRASQEQPAPFGTSMHEASSTASFTLVVVLLLRLSAALSVFGTLNRVGVIGTSPSVPPPSLSMKIGIGGPLSSWRRSKSRPSVLALIGGIASGKSTVSRALSAECGLEVIDADKLGHESYQPGTRCFSRLVDAFGSKIVSGDGTIDRRALGEAVRSQRLLQLLLHKA